MKKIIWLFLVMLFYGCQEKGPQKPKVPPTVEVPISVPNEPPVLLPSKDSLVISQNKLLLNGKEVFLRGLNIADPWHVIKRNWRKDPERLAYLLDHVFSGMRLGGNVVRIPILQRDRYREGFLDWPDLYMKQILRPLVDFITKGGQYVIIDCHYVQDFLKVERAELFLFWERMIDEFGNHPMVLFELFNEPINPNDHVTWKKYIQPVVNHVRSKSNNIILVGGPYWSSRMAWADTDPLDGDGIMYVGHAYSNQGTNPSKNYPKKRPLFITEWGWEVGGTEGGDLAWGKQFYKDFLADKHWTMWCYDDSWGPRMLNDDGSLSESGKFYKEIVS